ncbi:hypothetical protein LG198_07580 [Methylobacillus arboreus]|uniref:hypothetical protein n=1 Tax=Methylobacillus arboreus TaxID=755170 RepID=UPI001E2DB976|nr:hypothetical protein [Methylobacillus arboreus]MCB5190583.1 hypothetical protein [Methylobacillus arboreus]
MNYQQDAWIKQQKVFKYKQKFFLCHLLTQQAKKLNVAQKYLGIFALKIHPVKKQEAA